MTVRPGKSLVVLLFFYSLVFTTILFYGALSRGISSGNLLSIAFFFPLLFYFIREIGYQGKAATAYRDDTGQFTDYFRIVPFLTQGNRLLYLTLALYAAALALIYLRYHNILLISISF